MKTFETEKNNMPIGATHYVNATVVVMFCWFKFKNDKWYVMTENDSAWFICRNNEWKIYGAKPIPQTKEVEWANGDKCIYNDEEFTFVSYMCKPEEDHVVIWRSFDGIEVVYKTQISKPETLEAKKEREELEAAEDIYRSYMEVIDYPSVGWCALSDKNKEAFLAIVRKTGYRVER